jgi:hypothetical protein
LENKDKSLNNNNSTNNLNQNDFNNNNTYDMLNQNLLSIQQQQQQQVQMHSRNDCNKTSNLIQIKMSTENNNSISSNKNLSK